MKKKYTPLIAIIGGVLLFQLVNGFINHLKQPRFSYKSSEHVYADKYSSFLIPENWKDSITQSPESIPLVHLESPLNEASIDLSINNSITDTIKDLADFESRFHQSLLEKYTKTYFSQLGHYYGRGLIMHGKIQNKKEGYVKIFMHVDSIRSFVILECNTVPESDKITNDLNKIEASFKLQ